MARRHHLCYDKVGKPIADMSSCHGYQTAPAGAMNSTGWFLTNEEPNPLALPYTQRVYKCGWDTKLPDGSPLGCQNGLGMRNGAESSIEALLTPTSWSICWPNGPTTLTPTFSAVPCPAPPPPPAPPVEWQWDGSGTVQLFADESCSQLTSL